MSSPYRILFVCAGNIIRSPLAENLFRHLAAQAGMNGRFEADSAGTGNWHAGESPDARMRRTASRHGLIYDGSARQVRLSDFDRYDLIVAMDTDNRSELAARARSPEQRKKIRLLRDFDAASGPNASVPDPYFGGDEDFEATYRVVEAGVAGLLKSLRARKA
ncbi:MAG TPA: low molecular weight protein-tyrosine-phosphatase [Anaerolineales bacterium]|nr:low molecular weight protein-tyrosine-phosphatase [Anaerolineales bacterium]